MRDHWFQQALTAATAYGTPFPVEDMGGGVIEIGMTGTAHLYFEASGPITGDGGPAGTATRGGAGFADLRVVDSDGQTQTDAIGPGLFRVDVGGYSHIRVRVEDNTGTVNVYGRFTPDSLSLGPLPDPV